jgi:hypothetical protein
MNDPRRLLDAAGTPEARLLEAAMEEPAPSGLLERTLAAVDAGTVIAAAGSAVTAAKVGTKLAILKSTGGLAGAIGMGAIVGLATVVVVARGGGEIAPAPRVPVAIVGPRVDPAPHVAGTAPAILDVPTATPTVEAERAAPSATPALVASPTAAAPSTSASGASSLTKEIALLDEARSALNAGERAQAKALMDRYAREVPHGQLGREAAVVRARLAAMEPDAGADTNP